MFLRSSPGAVLESPAVSPTFSTSSDLLSTASTQCTELPSPEAREVVIKPFSEPEPVFGVSDLVVKDDRNPPNIRQTGGNRARVPSVPPPQFQGRLPHNTPPQPDLSLLHHPCKCHVSLCFAWSVVDFSASRSFTGVVSGRWTTNTISGH